MKKILKENIIRIIEWQARLVLRKYKPYVIAITGNVGKTSAKEAIFSVISSQYHTRKSQKSFNSEIGVPLTILGCPTGWSNPFIWIRNILKGFLVILFSRRYPEYLVLEVGADRPGDIRRICNWLYPDTGVVTALGNTPVHIEYFSSKEELIAEKSELVKSLSSAGKAVLNVDEENVANMRSLVEGRPIFYGFSGKADIRATHYSHSYDDKGKLKGFSFKVDYNGSSIPFSFKGFLGRQHVYAILAGVALGVSQGINMVAIQESLGEYTAQPGRVRILKGKRGSTVIDDSYNSSPAAVKAVLEEIEEIKTKGRKIAILGDMMDLGNHTYEEHRKVAAHALRVCDYIISVGARGRVITEEVNEDRMNTVKVFSNSTDAIDNFPLEIDANDVILVKGSQAIRMEKVTEFLLEDSDLSNELLVRQEEHWKKKDL